MKLLKLEHSNEDKTFITYFNYIKAAAQLFPEEVEKKLESIQQKKCKKSIQISEEVKNLIFLSWSTEILINEKYDAKGVVVYANLWAPVQLYYAIYSIVRGYLILTGCETNKHNKLLRALSNKIENEGHLFFGPWKTVYKSVSRQFSWIPSDVKITKVSNLKVDWENNQDNCWSFYKMFANSTLQKKIEEKYVEYEKKTKKCIIAKNIGSVCFLDLLYRLRKRCNYKDATIFTKGTYSLNHAQKFIDYIIDICFKSLLNFEFLIMQRCDFYDYKSLVDCFAQDISRFSDDKIFPFKRRFDLFKKMKSI